MTTSDRHLRLAAQLKKAGLISRVKKNYSNQEKGWITRKANQFQFILNNQDQFGTVTVSRKTAAKITSAAVKVKVNKKVRLIVPLTEPGEKLSVNRKGHIVGKKGGFTEERFPGGLDSLMNVDAIFDQVKGKKEYVMARLGNAKPFGTVFGSKVELMRYMNAWIPKDALSEDEKEKLEELESIQDEGYELDKKQARQLKRLHKKQLDKKQELLIEYFSIVKVHNPKAGGHNVEKKKAGKNSRH